jgi:hypothetical protein
MIRSRSWLISAWKPKLSVVDILGLVAVSEKIKGRREEEAY